MPRSDEDSIPVDIVLLPSPELAQKAVQASQALKPHQPLFTLSSAGPFPHVSLYMTQLKVADIDTANAIVAEIAARTHAFDLSAVRYVQQAGFLDPDYGRTGRLAALQMTVVDAINPIRDGVRAKEQARLATATGAARANIEQYGYRSVGELFRPHMTLTRFADSRAIDTNALPSPQHFSGQFTSLGLFEMGDNGTCARQIATFKLQSEPHP